MNNIIRQIREALIENGMDNVYSAFDAERIRDKGRIFTLVGIRSFEGMPPIYTDLNIYFPFSAEAEITISAPVSTSQEEIYDLYSAKAEPAMDSLHAVNSRLRTLRIYADRKTGRMHLTVLLKVGGIRTIERSAENE